MNRSSTDRAHRPNANVETSANTQNAAAPAIVIAWPTVIETFGLIRADPCEVVTSSGTPATCTAEAAATASTRVLMARRGRLRRATHPRYPDGTGPARPASRRARRAGWGERRL